MTQTLHTDFCPWVLRSETLLSGTWYKPMAMQKLRRDGRIGEGITMSEVTTERRTCGHHWVIQPADGPVNLGVCKVCRETREFRNYLDIWEWNAPGNFEAEEDE